MPVVMAKPRARITDVVMAVTLFDVCADCQNKARTSVIAITFWRVLRKHIEGSASLCVE